MPEVHQRPPKGQHPDLPTARARLAELIKAGHAFLEAWHPMLDRDGGTPYAHWIDDLLFTLARWEDHLGEIDKVVTREVAPLDLSDPAQLRRWLVDVESQVNDAVAAGEDATRPTGRRFLGRPLARKQIMDARRALWELIDAAERGIDLPAPR